MVHELGQAGMGADGAAAEDEADDGEEEGGRGRRVAGHHHQHQAEGLLLGQEGAGPHGQPVQQEFRVPGVLCRVGGGGQGAGEGGQWGAGVTGAHQLTLQTPRDLIYDVM